MISPCSKNGCGRFLLPGERCSCVQRAPRTRIVHINELESSHVGSTRSSQDKLTKNPHPTAGPNIIDCDPLKVWDIDPDYTCNNCTAGPLKARAMFPKANGKPVAAPLVVICHGNGVEGPNLYTKFDYLMRCLASNGFAVVSVSVPTGALPDQKIKPFRDHLINMVSLVKTTKGVDLTGQPLIFLGHSQGGVVVEILADEVRTGAIKPFKSVKAVVLLAPYHDLVKFPYANDFTESLLVMLGSLDEDQFWKGVASYDYANSDKLAFKALVWIHGGYHKGFIQALVKEPLFPIGSGGDNMSKLTASDRANLPIYPSAQNWLTVQYVVAFLRWRVLGHSEFAGLLKGDQLPLANSVLPHVQDNLNQGRLKFLTPLNRSRSSNEFFLSAMGPDNWVESADLTFPLFFTWLNALCKTCRNTAKGFVLKWDLSQKANPAITFHVFPGMLPHPLQGKFLCFNAVRVVDSPLNVSDADLLVRVVLSSGGLFSFPNKIVFISPSQRVSEFGGFNLSSTVLHTIRIPFSAFEGATPEFLSKLSGVSILLKESFLKKNEILLSEPWISVE